MTLATSHGSAPRPKASRLSGSQPPTRAYVERRTKEELSKEEIVRCLKRYVASAGHMPHRRCTWPAGIGTRPVPVLHVHPTDYRYSGDAQVAVNAHRLRVVEAKIVVADLADLIRSKESAGRPKDLRVHYQRLAGERMAG